MLVILLLFGTFLALKPMVIYAKDGEQPSEDWEAMYNDMVARYNVLKTDYDSLQRNYTKLKSDYDELIADYESLNTSYYETRTDYGVLETNYTLLKSDYDDLETDYNKLRMDYLRLNSSYYRLKADYDILMSDYVFLNASYLRLKEDYDDLGIEYNNTIVALEMAKEESGRNTSLMYLFGFTTIAFVLTTAYLVWGKISAQHSPVYLDVLDPCAEIREKLRVKKLSLDNMQKALDNEKKNLPKEPDGSENYDKKIANIDRIEGIIKKWEEEIRKIQTELDDCIQENMPKTITPASSEVKPVEPPPPPPIEPPPPPKPGGGHEECKCKEGEEQDVSEHKSKAFLLLLSDTKMKITVGSDSEAVMREAENFAKFTTTGTKIIKKVLSGGNPVVDFIIDGATKTVDLGSDIIGAMNESFLKKLGDVNVRIFASPIDEITIEYWEAKVCENGDWKAKKRCKEKRNPSSFSTMAVWRKGESDSASPWIDGNGVYHGIWLDLTGTEANKLDTKKMHEAIKAFIESQLSQFSSEAYDVFKAKNCEP